MYCCVIVPTQSESVTTCTRIIGRARNIIDGPMGLPHFRVQSILPALHSSQRKIVYLRSHAHNQSEVSRIRKYHLYNHLLKFKAVRLQVFLPKITVKNFAIMEYHLTFHWTFVLFLQPLMFNNNCGHIIFFILKGYVRPKILYFVTTDV